MKELGERPEDTEDTKVLSHETYIERHPSGALLLKFETHLSITFKDGSEHRLNMSGGRPYTGDPAAEGLKVVDYQPPKYEPRTLSQLSLKEKLELEQLLIREEDHRALGITHPVLDRDN